MIEDEQHIDGVLDDGQPVLAIGQKHAGVSLSDLPGGEIIPVNLSVEKAVMMVFYHYRGEGNKVICLNICADRIPAAGDIAAGVALAHAAQGGIAVHVQRTGGITKQSLGMGSLTGMSIPPKLWMKSVKPSKWISTPKIM